MKRLIDFAMIPLLLALIAAAFSMYCGQVIVAQETKSFGTLDPIGQTLAKQRVRIHDLEVQNQRVLAVLRVQQQQIDQLQRCIFVGVRTKRVIWVRGADTRIGDGPTTDPVVPESLMQEPIVQIPDDIKSILDPPKPLPVQQEQ